MPACSKIDINVHLNALKTHCQMFRHLHEFPCRATQTGCVGQPLFSPNDASMTHVNKSTHAPAIRTVPWRQLAHVDNLQQCNSHANKKSFHSPIPNGNQIFSARWHWCSQHQVLCDKKNQKEHSSHRKDSSWSFKCIECRNAPVPVCAKNCSIC